MDKLLTFEQYNNQLDEGLKTNILIGLLTLIGTSTFGGNKLPYKAITHTHSENALKSYIQQGWTLDSTQVDTVFTKVKSEKPDTIVMVTKLKLDKDQYFESGKFTLSQTVKDSLSNSMTDVLNDNGIITGIVVTSSTDKQGISANLQKLLLSLGYTADNQGLSKARNDVIRKYLTGELGVNSSLIESNEMFEQGNGIDPTARFVSVNIYYLQITQSIKSGPETTITKVNKTYHLSKDGINKTKRKLIRGGTEPQRLGPVSKFSHRSACWGGR